MDPVVGLYEAAFHAENTWWEMILAPKIQLQTASLAGELGAFAAGALPILAWQGVWLALGSGYLGARDDVSKENMASGYSQGLIMGLLDWEWPHVKSRFGVHGILRANRFDESLDVVKAKAYVLGIYLGFQTGKGFSSQQKKAYLSGIRKYANANKGNWTRNDQISYVIDLSTAYRKKFMRY